MDGLQTVLRGPPVAGLDLGVVTCVSPPLYAEPQGPAAEAPTEASQGPVRPRQTGRSRSAAADGNVRLSNLAEVISGLVAVISVRRPAPHGIGVT